MPQTTSGHSTGHSPARLLVITCAWLAVVANFPLWIALWRLPEVNGARGALLTGAFMLIVFGLLLTATSFFIGRHTVKPLAAFLLISAALGAYFVYTYGVVIDDTMIINTLQTHYEEVVELINLRLLLTLLVLAIVPLVWLWRRPVKQLSWRQQITHCAVLFTGGVLLTLLVLWAAFADMSGLMRNHKHLRYLINPLNSYYAIGAALGEPLTRKSNKLEPIAQDVKPGQSWARNARPLLVVLVVGETARSDHFGINGYPRNTTPLLAKENVVSFTDVTSCGTSTAASLPCMFSHLGRENYSARDAQYENLLDVIKRAGLAVLWRDNQAGCKGLCARVESESMEHLLPKGTCQIGECLDESMLTGLAARVQELRRGKSAPGALVVLHQLGSHGPAYYLRSPANLKAFTPECTSRALSDCDRQHVVNAYDNSIVYTDTFLAQTIAFLKTQAADYDTALLYVSDHGESLGENNLYLHGMPYALAPKAQKHVPMVVWLSNEAQARQGVSMACLQARRSEPLTHDYLFHSVMGLLDLQSSVVQPRLNLFAPCAGSFAPRP